MIDWSTTKFRASSWGNLFAEPVSKADKEAGKLGATCKKELVKIYNMVKYGRRKDIVQKQMTKGILCEPDSIILFSRVEQKIFEKNTEPLENEWFTGHPDIIYDNEVHDIKSSWELDTFTPKLVEEIDKGYEMQLQVYFDLTGATSGSIAYCLVDCPEEVLTEEKYFLLKRMNVISEESPEYVKAVAELEKNLTFGDIDYRQRVIKQPVQRNDDLIQKMKDKVPRLRQFLAELDEKHNNLYK